MGSVSGENGVAIRAFAAVRTSKNQPRGTVYVWADERQEIKSGGSPAWRNNNPGNLRPAASNVGQIGTAGGYAVFGSATAGLAAMTALLRRPLYQRKTLAQAMATYAPPEDHNPTAAYLAFVAKAVGVASNVLLAALSEAQLRALTAAMCRFEGWLVGTIEQHVMAA